MLPTLEKVEANINHSFQVNHLKTGLFPSPLHFHPEVEILLVVQGTGTRFIGDSVERFSPGDLVMIGGNVPHVWYSDMPDTKNDDQLDSEAVYVLFDPHIFGDQFWNLPESKKVLNLIKNSQRGIRISGKTKNEVSALMKDISTATGFDRISLLFKILTKITSGDDYEYLASPVFQNIINQGDSDRLNRVYQYVLNNSNRKITLEEVASLANFATPAFCRYFKQRVNKTFIQFLNEIRVGHACRLLANEDLSVADICFIAGFNHISYFIKQFKSATGQTPLKYRKSIYIS